MKLPPGTIIAPEKLTHYLLVRQPRNDKSAFLGGGGYFLSNADILLSDLRAVIEQHDALPVQNNKFGQFYEIACSLRGPNGLALRVRTIWMTEHLSNITKFITLLPSD